METEMINKNELSNENDFSERSEICIENIFDNKKFNKKSLTIE